MAILKTEAIVLRVMEYSETSLIAWMCSGEVPQQPPTMFTIPLSANSFSNAPIASGVWSYSPSGFGNPAFGWQLTQVGQISESSAT